MHLGSTEDAFITLKATNTANPNDTAVLTFNTQHYVSSLKQITQISKIKVYPNPVSEILSIDYTDVNQDFISIVNITGKTIQQMAINSNNGNISVNVSNLEQGVYFVKIGIQSIKFIKRD